MVVFNSPHPRLDVPTHLTTWQWGFESEHSSLHPKRQNEDGPGRYIDAVTKAQLDFREVKRLAELLSTTLVHGYGLKPGDVVSLFSANTVWYPVVVWATVRVGGQVNGASPAYSSDEMEQALRTAGTKFLFTAPASLPTALQAAAKAGLPRSQIFLLEAEAKGFRSVEDLVKEGEYSELVPPWSLPQGKTNKDICGYLNFSSGTTGLPKAVMLSHHNMIAQCHQLKQLQLVPPGKRYRILAVMPLFHITGLVRFVHYPVYMDGDSIMLPAFDLQLMINTVLTYQIEELILVPPILVRIIRDPVVKPYLPQLQAVVKRWSSGSAPIAPEVIKALHKLFPNSGFRQGYGATETTACTSCHPPSHFDYKYATGAGLLCANTSAKVMSVLAEDDIGGSRRELGVGQTGEIWVKGPQMAMGYLNNPRATEETFHVDHDGDDERWFHTGDIGHIDAEGMLYIEDRIKEMIKVKGQQVAPAELEDCLMGHDDVEDCAVIGVRDDYAGERPKAYVVLKPGRIASQQAGQALMKHVEQQKVRYKRLKEVEFTKSIPKSATGKLLRRVLKAGDRHEGRTEGLRVYDDAERPRL